jgi:MarR family transcriptional regulator, transcriptional regulator for hemolysin
MLAANAIQMLQRDAPANAGNREGSDLLAPIQDLGFSLIDVGRLYMRRFQRRSREPAIDLMQCRVLLTLAQNEGVTQRSLSELTAIDPTVLGRMLDRLQSLGWAERRLCPGDRRARLLAITPAAKALIPNIRKMVAESQRAALKGVSRDETRILVKALERTLANLKAHESGSGEPSGADVEGFGS